MAKRSARIPVATVQNANSAPPSASAISGRVMSGASGAWTDIPGSPPSATGDLIRRPGADRQGMDRAGQLSGERLVDHPVPFDTRMAGEAGRDDRDDEMRLAGLRDALHCHMLGVFTRFILDKELIRPK